MKYICLDKMNIAEKNIILILITDGSVYRF
jgi:hypothetical protein